MTNKKKVITSAAAAVIFALSSVYMSGISESLVSQNMAERWRAGELKYSQVSVFYPQGSHSYDSSEPEQMRNSIEEKIKTGSFKPENEGASVWKDCWSSVPTVLNVYMENKLTGAQENAGSGFSVTGIGGDFFNFHPLKLVSGSYIYDSELRNDRVVLDEQAAWNIFSSADVVGMTLSINQQEFEVAGVVRREDVKSVEKVYPEKPVIYMHYDALEEAGADMTLLCYESVLPDPVTNYAKGMILEKFGINTMSKPEDGKDPEGELDVVVTENTGRYSIPKLWNGLRNFDTLFVSDRSIAFPYWENAARVNTVRMEILFFICIVTAAYIFIILVLTAGKLWLNRKWHLKDFLEDMMYKYTYKKRTSDYISLDINDTDDGKEKKYEQ